MAASWLACAMYLTFLRAEVNRNREASPGAAKSGPHGRVRELRVEDLPILLPRRFKAVQLLFQTLGFLFWDFLLL